jgi:hypothetical protein
MPNVQQDGSWWMRPMSREEFSREIAERFAVNRANQKLRGFEQGPHARLAAAKRGAAAKKASGLALWPRARKAVDA